MSKTLSNEVASFNLADYVQGRLEPIAPVEVSQTAEQLSVEQVAAAAGDLALQNS